ncbi:cell division cycle-associated protein 3 [Heterodontus francisci]|uniref:cell division cycle-associated protein 3 n=1 Tax=Heterodontus francisci TaxID=7792 RepID=UPI00355B0452
MMGSSGSTCAETPVRAAYNKHLSNALDPRSPTAGILRTPIEVLSSPSPCGAGAETELEEVEDVEEDSGPVDPRSPTPGVTRTPLKLTMTDKFNKLVRQLSGVFISEEPECEEPVSSISEGSSEEEEEEAAGGLEDLVEELLECEGEPAGNGERVSGPEAGEKPLPGPMELAAAAPAAVEGRPQAEPRNLLPEEDHRVTKRKHAKQTGRALSAPGKARSPLKPLRNDNSPSSVLARRQVKKALGLSENAENPSPRNLLKLSRSRPFYQDKENSSYRLLTGELTVCPH